MPAKVVLNYVPDRVSLKKAISVANATKTLTYSGKTVADYVGQTYRQLKTTGLKMYPTWWRFELVSPNTEFRTIGEDVLPRDESYGSAAKAYANWIQYRSTCVTMDLDVNKNISS